MKYEHITQKAHFAVWKLWKSMKQMEHQVPAAVIRAHLWLPSITMEQYSFSVGRANDLLSATGEINPSFTLSVLMLGGKTDKGNGAEWEEEESLPHLLTRWLTTAICPYLRGAGPMEEEHWPTEGSRGLQSWRGPSEVKNKTTRLTTFNNPRRLHITSQILTSCSCYIWALIINPSICLLLWDTCLFMSTSAIFCIFFLRLE